MENQRDLFNLCCKVIDKISEDMSVNNLIQFNMAYDKESVYMNKEKENELYYIKGWCGEMTDSSVIKYHTRLYKRSFNTNLKEEFKFYQGDIKQQVEENCNSENIIWYDLYECENGNYNWKKIIKSKEDLIQMLKEDYRIEDYGYTIEGLLK